ncbi:MAG: hypothetical protein RML45_01640 [Acetobacteraceae bacterium]|nr:hypothetical protein [Acetobacteraceae bacterium]
MKLASLREGGRDGRLLLVSRDLARAERAATAATLAGRAGRLGTARPRPRGGMDRLRDGLRRAAFPSILPPAPRRCRAPINGQTGPPTSITSRSFGARAVRRCHRPFTTTR